MARRSKDQLKAEFERLYAIFEIILDFENQMMPDEFEAKDHIATREEMLGWVTNGNTTLSGLINGIQMAINEFQMGLLDFDETTHYLRPASDQGPDANKFLAFYLERTGREFYRDITDVKKTTNAVIKKGQIATEAEYYIMTDIINDLSQNVLNPTELAQIGDMIDIFEDKQWTNRK